MKTFDEKALNIRLAKLSTKSRVAFAACCATRLRPAYRAYHVKTEAGDLTILDAALAFVWLSIDGPQDVNKSVAESHIEQVMALMPQEDDKWTELSKFAEDSVAAVAYALRCSMRNNPSEAAKEAAWAARRVFESVSSYITETKSIDLNRKGFSELIDREPIMQMELTRQARDLDDLEDGKLLVGKDWLSYFKTRAESEPALSL